MKKLPLFFLAGTLVLVLAVVFAALPSTVSAGKSVFPDTIPLPDGFRPEGVVFGQGTTIFAGSLANGAVYRADVRTGEGDVFIPGATGPAVGLSFDDRANNLFVSGGPGGDARVYDAGSGELLMSYQLAAAGTAFINDAIVTREAVYFTDSFNPRYFRVPLNANGRLADASAVQEIALGGDFVFVPAEFNANGIEASANGAYLIIVNSNTGTLYRVDPLTGEAAEIDLGGEVVTSGDGLVLQGHTLYVVRNSLNQIAVVELGDDFTSGEIVDTITSDAFRIPTTADRLGSSLYAVNARFDTAPLPDTDYDIVRVPR